MESCTEDGRGRRNRGGGGEEAAMDSSKAVLQAVDVVAVILQKIESPQDLLSAAAVCRTWRTVANDPSQLRSWTLDDVPTAVAGSKVSVTPMLPKTPPPRHWINPTTHSPFASFNTPRSLRIPAKFAAESSGQGDALAGTSAPSDGNGQSPRTPSPMQQLPVQSLKQTISHKMVMGSNLLVSETMGQWIGFAAPSQAIQFGFRYLGDIDICSSSLNDECLRIITQKCPRLHTLRLLHICESKQTSASDALFFPNRAGELELSRSGNKLFASCGCSHLSEKGFSDISVHCPDLISVTLVLQHITSRKVLQDIFVELGKLVKLQTLSVELRMPSFGQSLKSEVIWEWHLRCTDKEILALIEGGGPPLHALALNRCDLTEVSINALTKACPHIEAIDLHSHFQSPKDQGLHPGVPLSLKDLTSLSAAAFGVVYDLGECQFGDWKLLSLKRLRLESKEPLGVQHLEGLRCSCPQLESLHLIWNSYNGPREAHIYPFTREGIMDYVQSVFV